MENFVQTFYLCILRRDRSKSLKILFYVCKTVRFIKNYISVEYLPKNQKLMKTESQKLASLVVGTSQLSFADSHRFFQSRLLSFSREDFKKKTRIPNTHVHTHRENRDATESQQFKWKLPMQQVQDPCKPLLRVLQESKTHCREAEREREMGMEQRDRQSKPEIQRYPGESYCDP